MRVRSLVIWLAVGVPVLLGLLFAVNLLSDPSQGGRGQLFEAVVINAWFYGLIAAWALRKSAGNGVEMRELVGGVPSGFRWRPVVGMVALLMLFTLCTSWLFLYLLSSFLPHLVDTFTAEEIFTTGDRSDYAGLYNAQAFIATAIVAPVVEELFFRGMLLTRWSLKWGPTAGILASSALFGVLHVGFFGAFAFGVAMCLLYIKTRTLIVPIAAHMLNNLVATAASAIALGADAGGGAAGFQGSEVGLALAAAGAIATLSLLLWYVIRNWPRRGETAPYLLRGAPIDLP